MYSGRVRASKIRRRSAPTTTRIAICRCANRARTLARRRGRVVSGERYAVALIARIPSPINRCNLGSQPWRGRGFVTASSLGGRINREAGGNSRGKRGWVLRNLHYYGAQKIPRVGLQGVI